MRDSIVTEKVISKVDAFMSDSNNRVEMYDYLNATEPLLLDEISKFENAFLSAYHFKLESVCGMEVEDKGTEAYRILHDIMVGAFVHGFVISREASHVAFNEIVNLDSLVGNIKSSTKKPE